MVLAVENCIRYGLSDALSELFTIDAMVADKLHWLHALFGSYYIVNNIE
jgi:hypothetical protein